MGNRIARRSGIALALVAALALTAFFSAAASAATPPSLWTRCDGDPEDVSCSVARGVATAPATAPEPGSVYVADQGNSRVVQYSVWGEFVRAWGWGVEDGAEEFQICDEPSGCSEGIAGSGSGQFFRGVGGIAVDSAGNVYVADINNRRVQKFDSEGNFVLMVGGKVNKTKVEAAAPEAQQNLCTAASGDVCQVGVEGAGPGQFKGWPFASFIAIGASDRLYVGDEKRIQIFNPDGTFKETQPDPDGAIAKGTVSGLAFAQGSIFFFHDAKADVIRLNTAGKVQCTIKADSPSAVAARPGFAYVIDDVPGPSSLVRQFRASDCAEVEEPFGSGEITDSTGIAAGTACLTSGADVYVTNISPAFARAYGPTPNKLELCPKPLKAPDILAQYAISVGASIATVRASINPHFYADTTYYVEYASTACIEAGGWEAACVEERPSPPGGNTLAASGDNPANTASILLSGLAPGTEYRFRFVAQSGGGLTNGVERSFHTFAVPSTLPETCPNDLFRSGAGAHLPDCRAYEMVSPVDKEGGEIQSNTTGRGNPTARYQSATTGDKLAYTAELSFGDAISQPFTSQYIASRGDDGWLTHAISPPRGVLLGGTLAGQDSEYKLFSADLCDAWLVADNTTAPPLAPGGEEGTNNAYRRSNCGAEGYEALGWGIMGSTITPMEVQGASADGSRALVRTEGHLAQDVGTPVGMQLECETPTAAEAIAFQWLRNGEPIAGKTAAIYKAEAGDEGAALQCRVTATNANGGATQVANPAWIVEPYPATVPPEAPDSIAGPTASAALTVGGAGGQTLECDPDAAAWSGSPSFAYRWYRNGAEIAGATASTYSVAPADLATPAAFQCEAIGTNAGASVAKTSENLTTVPAPSEPGAPQVDARSVVAGPSDSQGPMVYLADGEGGVRTVCVLPDGTAEKGCSAGTLEVSTGYEGSVIGALSSDGSRVYWGFTSVFEDPSRLYLRENAGEPQSAFLNGRAKGKGDLTSGSDEITGLSTANGAFEVGQEVEAAFGGVAPGTTIVAIEGSTLTLSANATRTEAGAALTAFSECSEPAKACTTAVSEGNAQFWGASPDGERAIYLADIGAAGKLYEFDAATGESSEIADGVSGLLGMSKDARRIYLVSIEVISATPNGEGDVAQEGKPNLYLYDGAAGGSFDFVATLSDADGPQTSVSPTRLVPINHMARVSPDGGVAAFGSTGNLVGYDNTDANSGKADMEVYRYEASSRELKCVSCNPSGARPVGELRRGLGNTAFWAAAQIQPAQHNLYYSHALSDDGSRLYFESFEALVLADTNGKRDVYQWEAVGKGTCAKASTAFSQSAGGCVSLISSGKSPLDSEFVDASPSGNDVFFRTATSLVTPLDPGQFDIYDARVGGGFAQPEPEPPCEGDACQPPGAEPEDPTPASSAFQQANANANTLAPRRRCTKGKRRIVRKGKARCIRKHQLKKRTHKARRAGQ